MEIEVPMQVALRRLEKYKILSWVGVLRQKGNGISSLLDDNDRLDSCEDII